MHQVATRRRRRSTYRPGGREDERPAPGDIAGWRLA